MNKSVKHFTVKKNKIEASGSNKQEVHLHTIWKLSVSEQLVRSCFHSVQQIVDPGGELLSSFDYFCMLKTSNAYMFTKDHNKKIFFIFLFSVGSINIYNIQNQFTCIVLLQIRTHYSKIMCIKLIGQRWRIFYYNNFSLKYWALFERTTLIMH